MYKNEDNDVEDVLPSTPQSKEQKIDVRSVGKLTAVVIDGKEVFVVDPLTVQKLTNKMILVENDLRNTNINLSNARKVIESLQSRIAELEKNMNRIFND
jgi:hypothetical protein